MGETKKKDQPTKRRRQLCGLGKSSSDSEIARGKGKERWPFPQSLTVDELARYRRRRVQGRPKDSLCRAEGSLGNLITEYRRAFRASSEDIWKERAAAGFVPDSLNHHDDPSLLTERAIIKAEERSKEPACNPEVADAQEVMEMKTESSRFVPHLNAPGRPPLLRRGTSLKHEGKFIADTEQSCYVAHEGVHRAELARRPTSLRMEGDMSMMSENCEKFIEWLNVSRPELARLPTHLRLEGDFETSTENHEKYVPFVGARRPEILRQSANLKMEGESRHIPEYKDVFRNHNLSGKRSLKKPETHLTTEGNFYNTTETSEQFVNPRSVGEANLDGEENRKLDTDDEDDVEDLTNTDKIERLAADMNEPKGPPLEIPEYRDAFKDFPRERPRLMKPDDEIGRSDGSKISSSSPTRAKFSTKIDMDPEYKSKYLDYSKDSPVYRKPPLALRPSGRNSGLIDSVERTARNLGSGNRSSRPRNDARDENFRQKLFEATTEVRSQYVPYGNIPRVESVKMPAHLQLEGSIDLQPEYRNAYCTQRNHHLPTGEPRMHRRRERSSSESRRRDNYWTNNNNTENFGRPNPGDDQDAFQVLQTRVHEDSLVGKPPSGSRRGSLGLQRPTTHVEATDPSVLRRRSPSPTYRLHVCNVDDEPRGFGRNRHPGPGVVPAEVLPSENESIIYNPKSQRPYSPSFGREDPKSFVVLQDNDSAQANRDPVTSRGRSRATWKPNIDKIPGNVLGRELIGGSSRTPKSWMRPWYDNAGN
ncbi:uncharacterized protein LOC124181220 [Neodiprion fabricii]|uniref:uncharacterized protein LOC124181220 n=1 Tax=Neodiprion fabricii TaxID=2872261 RepID=UPI001ED95A4C|nr:uncharacterized protein LOC124181220 [Neodiprion fabricii]